MSIYNLSTINIRVSDFLTDYEKLQKELGYSTVPSQFTIKELIDATVNIIHRTPKEELRSDSKTVEKEIYERVFPDSKDQPGLFSHSAKKSWPVSDDGLLLLGKVREIIEQFT